MWGSHLDWKSIQMSSVLTPTAHCNWALTLELSQCQYSVQEKVVVHQMDLSDLDSVAAFAKAIKDERIDIIVCNAGVMCPPYTLTKQGFETTMGINHHGHFYLLQLLTPRLKSQVPICPEKGPL